MTATHASVSASSPPSPPSASSSSPPMHHPAPLSSSNSGSGTNAQVNDNHHHDSLADQEESVRIAVRALGDMRSGAGGGNTTTTQRRSSSSRYTYDDDYDYDRQNYSYDRDDSASLRSPGSRSSYATAPSHVSRTTSASTAPGMSGSAEAATTFPSPASNTNGTAAAPAPATGGGGGGLVSRMSHFPLVGSAMRVYEQGKASSRVVKYGAEMVESSVKSISRPVIDRLPVNVDRLDEFACRQLDRLDRYRRPSTNDIPPSTATATTPTSHITSTTASTSNVRSSSISSSSHGIKQEEEEGSDREMAIDDRHRARSVGGHIFDQGRVHGYPQSQSRGASSGKEGYDQVKAEEEEEEEEEEDVDMDAEIEGSPIITRREWVVRDGHHSDIVVRGGPGSAPGPGLGSARGRGGRVPSWLEATSPFVAPPPPPPEDYQSRSRSDARGNRGSRSSTPTQASNNAHNGNSNEGQVAQRSRWQAVLLEAGGLSAALSEESMRRLKYCLQWLQYATAHIDAQILILRDFTASLQPLPGHPSSHPQPRPPISPEQLRKLTVVRRDLVHTIRQVVDVVSKYAGASLPEPARKRVRGFILKLPQRWANVAKQKAGFGSGGAESLDMSDIGGGERQDRGESSSSSSTVAAAAGAGTGVVRRPGGQRRAGHRERGVDGYRSGPSSRATSPVRGGASAISSGSPRATRAAFDRDREREDGGAGQGASGAPGPAVSASTAIVAAQRILALATESLDMMRGVTGVVKDSLDRAETWVGRFRTVGIQRATDGGAIPEGALPPGFEDFSNGDSATHTRDGSSHGRDRDGFDFEFSDRMRYRHTRNVSDNSNYDDRDRESPTPPSFFSATASSSGSTRASSVPGTPATTSSGGQAASSYPSFGGYHNNSGSNSKANPNVNYAQSHSQGYTVNTTYGSLRAPQSPLAIPLSAMSLGSAANSRYGSQSGSLNGTPRSVIVGLPEEEKEDVDVEDRRQGLGMKDMDVRRPVKVVQPGEDITAVSDIVDVRRERMDVDA